MCIRKSVYFGHFYYIFIKFGVFLKYKEATCKRKMLYNYYPSSFSFITSAPLEILLKPFIFIFFIIIKKSSYSAGLIPFLIISFV